jgi:hypothetical protein
MELKGNKAKDRDDEKERWVEMEKNGKRQEGAIAGLLLVSRQLARRMGQVRSAGNQERRQEQLQHRDGFQQLCL